MEDSRNFISVDISEAQDLVNAGNIIIAAYKAPTGSGHVALVVPSDEKVNGGWRKDGPKKDPTPVKNLPQVMDTGNNKRTERQNVTDSFRRSTHKDVKFFRYTPKVDN
jgi:hypothetical protein